MSLVRYALRRLAWLAPVLVGISLLTFSLMHLLPGGPWDPQAAGRRFSPTVVANYRARYGFDRPLHEQYLLYMGNLVRGDLGISLLYQDRAITDILRQGLAPTLILAALALLLALAIGPPLGALAALHGGRRARLPALLVGVGGIAIPNFVLAMLLVLVFAVQLGWLAVSGWVEPAADPAGFLRHALLPAVCLGLAPAAVLARITSASVAEVMRDEHVAVARAKGLPARSVIVRHILRNALIPIITVGGLLAADLIAGSFVVETIFSVPGIGRLFVQAVAQRDYNLVMGTTLFFTTVVVVVNLVVDLVYGVVDPRIRYG